VLGLEGEGGGFGRSWKKSEGTPRKGLLDEIWVLLPLIPSQKRWGSLRLQVRRGVDGGVRCEKVGKEGALFGGGDRVAN